MGLFVKFCATAVCVCDHNKWNLYIKERKLFTFSLIILHLLDLWFLMSTHREKERVDILLSEH